MTVTRVPGLNMARRRKRRVAGSRRTVELYPHYVTPYRPHIKGFRHEVLTSLEMFGASLYQSCWGPTFICPTLGGVIVLGWALCKVVLG